VSQNTMLLRAVIGRENRYIAVFRLYHHMIIAVSCSVAVQSVHETNSDVNKIATLKNKTKILASKPETYTNC